MGYDYRSKEYKSYRCENTMCLVEALRFKYTKDQQNKIKTESCYIKFPKDYFEDIKFFLECKNETAVMALIAVLEDIPLKNPKGKCELRELKNASIVFMTLFVNVLVAVFGDLEDQVSSLGHFITRAEEIDQIELLRKLTIETMINMVQNQKCLGNSCYYSSVVYKAIEIIKRDFREKIKLQTVAKELMISENYLSKCLKKETGKGYKDHIQEIRIEEAKQRLIKTDASVYDIAIAVGFNYQNHFASVFKKYAGIAPLEYRNRHFQ